MIEKISRFCLSIVSVSHKNFSCKSPIFLYLHWEWISSLSVYFFLHSRGLKYNQIILLLRGIWNVRYAGSSSAGFASENSSIWIWQPSIFSSTESVSQFSRSIYATPITLPVQDIAQQSSGRTSKSPAALQGRNLYPLLQPDEACRLSGLPCETVSGHHGSLPKLGAYWFLHRRRSHRAEHGKRTGMVQTLTGLLPRQSQFNHHTEGIQRFQKGLRDHISCKNPRSVGETSRHLFCIRRYFYDGFLLSGYFHKLNLMVTDTFKHCFFRCFSIYNHHIPVPLHGNIELAAR